MFFEKPQSSDANFANCAIDKGENSAFALVKMAQNHPEQAGDEMAVPCYAVNSRYPENPIRLIFSQFLRLEIFKMADFSFQVQRRL